MYLYKSIEQFSNLYFSTSNHSKKTIQSYKIDLTQFKKFIGKNIKISSIEPEIIENWAIALKEKEYSPASIQRKLTTLKIFFNYWVRKNKLSTSPLWKLKINFGNARVLPKILDENEITTILSKSNKKLSRVDVEKISNISRDFLSLRNVAIVEIMFNTGIRVGELVSLNITDFNKEERYLYINGKGNRQRMAFLMEEHCFSVVVLYLETLMKILPDNRAFFVNIFRSRLSTQGVANVIEKIAKNSGINKHITPHMLRHTIATLLLKNGADVRVVQEFLGHSSITTTQRYTHITKEHLISQLKNFHPGQSIIR